MWRALSFVALAAGILGASTPVLANTYTVVFNASVSWTQAQAAAQLAGGYLAKISSATEQAAVEAAISAAMPPQNGAFWIGLRESTECQYVWDGGGATCYAHWYSGEPNNGAGGPAENRGQMMWNLSDASRRGFWNDVPDAGTPGSTDINRLGYIIETGPADNVPTCGFFVPVNPGSFCNAPPPGATVVKTKVTGMSTVPMGTSAVLGGKNTRTITDISEPPAGPSWARPASIQATQYFVNLTVGSGASALAVDTALIDSINHQAGAAGFIASFKSNTTDTVQMYRATGRYTSSDDNGIPGITLTSYTYVAPAGSPAAAGPGLSPAGVTILALLLLLLGGGALWLRLPRPRSRPADDAP